MDAATTTNNAPAASGDAFVQPSVQEFLAKYYQDEKEEEEEEEDEEEEAEEEGLKERRSSMPRLYPSGISKVQAMYKEANGIFLRHLYQAAAEIMEPGQLAQLGAQAPSPDGNGPVALSGKESYLWLARVVAANGTQRHVTREMMRALQAEISGRLVVDEWHRDAGDLSGDGWKRGRSGKGHGNFTEMLEEVMAVLRPKFDCVCSFAPEVLAQVDEEVFLLSLET